MQRVLNIEKHQKRFCDGNAFKRVYYGKKWGIILLYKCIGKGFTIGIQWEVFIIRLHWKKFYYRNALEKGLL